MGGLLRPLEGVKILVTDDTKDIQIMFTILLDSAGATVDVANDGLEAITKSTVTIYDIILMDLRMPGLTGYEAIAQIRNNGYSNPVIAITAQLGQREITACQKAGFSDYIGKCATQESLVSKILGLLSR